MKTTTLKHKDYLSLLSKGSKQQKRRCALIDLANSGEIRSVIECIYNVLLGNVSLKAKDKKRLMRYKNIMRLVTRKNINARTKKKVLKQKGGFLSTLLPLALSPLGAIIPNLLGNK